MKTAKHPITSLTTELFSIRNQYGEEILTQKISLINKLNAKLPANKDELQLYYEALLFLIAYPDNTTIYQLATDSLDYLSTYISLHEGIRARLFNSGVTGTQLCATYSFELVKWFRKTYPDNIFIASVEADDGTIQAILSAVLPKVESEILQDANYNWRTWLKTSPKKPDLLDKLLAIFEQSDIRPEVKDELWNALGLDVEIDFPSQTRLPQSLIKPFYHRAIIKKHDGKTFDSIKPVKIKLSESEAEQIVDCSRMILVRHLREMDPITFTSPELVSYYHLSRGVSVAIMAMTPDRRHPVDSYMSYVAFKNGLPVAYGGSWVLFDSSRTALNVFPAYRGGESQYLFAQILDLHKQVFHLKRFVADSYQIGKENHDGIKSGSFWLYYHLGFRPIEEEQKQIAEAEALKIKNTKGYRTPAAVLTKLADSRIELLLQKGSVRFDAVDISIAYANIIKKNYNGDRKLAEQQTFNKLVSLLKIKNPFSPNLNFVLKNWCVLLLANEQGLRKNKKLLSILKKIFELKANGSEEVHIVGVRRSKELRRFIENILRENEGKNFG
jgi:hypothetical protein